MAIIREFNDSVMLIESYLQYESVAHVCQMYKIPPSVMVEYLKAFLAMITLVDTKQMKTKHDDLQDLINFALMPPMGEA